jgi:hypothetical protein
MAYAATAGGGERSSVASDIQEEGSSQTLAHRSVWRWTLRWWWLVAFLVTAGAVAGYLWGRAATPEYESDAIVVASQTEFLSEDFGNLAETLVATDTVIEPVIQELGLETSPQALLRGKQVEARAIPGAVAVRIIGRSPDPEVARALARTTADSFSRAAFSGGLGEFQVFGSAPSPGAASWSPATWAFGGAAAGGFLALSVLLLIAFVRHPVLTTNEARREALADRSFAVRLRRVRGRRRWQAYPRGVVADITRAIQPQGGRVGLVMIKPARGGASALRALAVEVRAQLTSSAGEPPTGVVSYRIGSTELEPTGGAPAEALAQANAIVVLVPWGAPRRSLRLFQEAATVLAGPDRPRIVVFATRMRRRAGGVEAEVGPVREPPGSSGSQMPAAAAPGEAGTAPGQATSETAGRMEAITRPFRRAGQRPSPRRTRYREAGGTSGTVPGKG